MLSIWFYGKFCHLVKNWECRTEEGCWKYCRNPLFGPWFMCCLQILLRTLWEKKNMVITETYHLVIQRCLSCCLILIEFCLLQVHVFRYGQVSKRRFFTTQFRDLITPWKKNLENVFMGKRKNTVKFTKLITSTSFFSHNIFHPQTRKTSYRFNI